MAVIGCNCLTMGIQVDYRDLSLWRYVENMFLFIFLFELVIRLKFEECGFFYNQNWATNWLDFVIVAGAMTDLWLMPAASFLMSLVGIKSDNHGDAFGQVM